MYRQRGSFPGLLMNRLTHIGCIALFLLALFLPAAGCNNSSPDGNNGDSGDSAGSDATDDGPDADDQSLAIAAYVGKGIPDPANEWTPGDYKRAAAILALMAHGDHPEQMPRLGSPRSGKLFARMIEENNLTLLADLPADKRRDPAMLLQGAVMAIETAYHGAIGNLIRKADPYRLDIEAVEVDGFLLEVLLRTTDAELAYQETRRGTERTDVIETARNKALRDLTGFAIALIGRFNQSAEFRDNDHFRPEAMRRLLKHLANKLPRVASRVTPAARDEIRAVIDDQVTRIYDQDIRAELTRIASLVK